MNPGKLNHRIRFIQLTQTQNEYLGSEVTGVPVICSDIEPTDVTWGDLQPIRQYNQLALEAGASVLNGDKILIIRYRKTWQPEKDMLFEDITNAGIFYTIHAILPYYQGAKATFQNTDETPYQDKVFIYILGIKRQ